MKHIKAYKLFESSYEHIEEIKYLKDIFQELEDKGFDIKIGHNLHYNTNNAIHRLYPGKIPLKKDNIINIIGKNENKLFKASDISDYVLSAIDYMTAEGYVLLEHESFLTRYFGARVKLEDSMDNRIPFKPDDFMVFFLNFTKK